MIQNIKPNNKVMIMPHKDNTHPEVIGQIGKVRIIHNSEGTDLYYVQTDNYFEDLPPYVDLNIPQGYCYISVYEELALIE
jgi:hypothetical protein